MFICTNKINTCLYTNKINKTWTTYKTNESKKWINQPFFLERIVLFKADSPMGFILNDWCLMLTLAVFQLYRGVGFILDGLMYASVFFSAKY